MDTLAEVRRITLKFNLKHPDSTQYAFIHIREINADSVPLPLSGVPRRGLDTVIYGDSIAAITLRPGGAALLEITYAPPDESFINGNLAYSGQRKILFDGRRYHATYYRYDTVAWGGLNLYMGNVVYYRQSLPVDSTTGSILWFPWETRISYDPVQGPQQNNIRLDSRHPSLTWRKVNNDTIISVVWTCHPHDSIITGVWDREVCLRDINVTKNIERDIATVDHHAGTEPEQWGTPVICHADGGDFIAWSDSTLGIMARFRLLDTNLGWAAGSVFSGVDSVSFLNPTDPCSTGPAQYPSVPTFVNLDKHDSTCAIVWQRTNDCPQAHPLSGWTDIYYARLIHDGTPPNGTPLMHAQNHIPVSAQPLQNVHPSIDQVQDDYGNLYEGVVWEDYNAKPLIATAHVMYRSINTQIPDPTFRKSIGASYGWGISSLSDTSYPKGTIYPNTAWVRQIHYYPWTNNGWDSIYYSVAFMRKNGVMTQAPITFGGQGFNTPIDYMYGGLQPNGSATPLQLNANDGRHAVLYRDVAHTDSALRTTRQFFARVRPTDYLARGRHGVIRLDTLARAALSVHLFDAWIATDSSAAPLAPQPRANMRAFTDSLPQVQSLMRTECFAGHDSVLIGCEVGGEFTGDTSIGHSAKLTCYAELVDSASGGTVVVLDSFRVSWQDTAYTRSIERVADLLSGTYYVRLRMIPDSLPVVACASGAVYPVIEMAGMVESNNANGYGKRMRAVAGKAGSVARISAQPTPFRGQTELRFSLPRADYATVTVYDSYGRVVARPVLKGWVEAGRYAVEVDGSQWEPGVYVAELRAGRGRVTAMLSVVR